MHEPSDKPVFSVRASSRWRTSRQSLGVIIILVGCIISFVNKLIARRGLTPEELTDAHRLTLQIVWAAILSVGVILTTLYIDRLPLSSIGIRRLRGRNIVIGLVFLIGGTAIEVALEPVAALWG
jgi:hypothetical protein